MKFTREQIEAAVKSKNYAYFTKGEYNVNIIGVRNSDTCNRVTNHYDDLITISYMKGNKWKYFTIGRSRARRSLVVWCGKNLAVETL